MRLHSKNWKGTRAQKAKRLRDLIENGPHFSFGFPFGGDDSIPAEPARKAEAEAARQFKIWAGSWVMPLLEDLVKELAPAESADDVRRRVLAEAARQGRHSVDHR